MRLQECDGRTEEAPLPFQGYYECARQSEREPVYGCASRIRIHPPRETFGAKALTLLHLAASEFLGINAPRDYPI